MGVAERMGARAGEEAEARGCSRQGSEGCSSEGSCGPSPHHEALRLLGVAMSDPSAPLLVTENDSWDRQTEVSHL